MGPVFPSLFRSLVVLCLLSIFTCTAQAVGWTTVASMPTGVSNQAATVDNGKIYVAGGVIGSTPQNSLQIYNISANSWSAGAPMPSANSQISGFQDIAGTLYFVGGYTFGPPGNQLNVYSVAGNSWSTGNNVPTESAGGTSGVISGKLYVTSPLDGSALTKPTLQQYDPGTTFWTNEAPMNFARSSVSGEAIGGKFYVAGGYDTSATIVGTLEAYDATSGTWSTLASMPTGVSHAAAANVNGLLYVIGGIDSTGNIRNLVQIYNPTSDSWSSGPALPLALAGETASFSGNTIYVAGGDSPTAGNDLSSVYSLAVAVPEPASAILLSVGILALSIKPHRRR